MRSIRDRLWPRTMKPGGVRDRFRQRRLRFWLSLMAECERLEFTDCEIYYWLSRRAMACNAWSKI